MIFHSVCGEGWDRIGEGEVCMVAEPTMVFQSTEIFMYKWQGKWMRHRCRKTIAICVGLTVGVEEKVT